VEVGDLGREEAVEAPEDVGQVFLEVAPLLRVAREVERYVLEKSCA